MPGKVTWAQSDAFKPASARWARGTSSTCAVPPPVLRAAGQITPSLPPAQPSFLFSVFLFVLVLHFHSQQNHTWRRSLASSLHWPLLDFHLPFNSLRPGVGGGGLDTFLQMPRISKPGCNLAARLENAEAKAIPREQGLFPPHLTAGFLQVKEKATSS